MTGNSVQIRKLKNEQLRKKKLIKDYKANMKRHIFWIVLLIALVTFYFLEDSYKLFGNSINYLLSVAASIVVLIFLYYLLVVYLTKKREKEIKKINSRLYRLMKLQND